jgi:hypothetical protein
MIRPVSVDVAKLDPPEPTEQPPYPPARAWVNSSIGRKRRR